MFGGWGRDCLTRKCVVLTQFTITSIVVILWSSMTTLSILVRMRKCSMNLSLENEIWMYK